MRHDYSENVLIQESAAGLFRDELGWEFVYAYNTKQLGDADTLGRKSYKKSCCPGIFGRLCCA